MRHLLLLLPSVYILCVLLVLGAGAHADDETDGLPSIWSGISEKRQYHTMFQVQMLNSSERLTFEEWASFDSGKHRLDLISDNGRTTYLTNAKTGEVFMYRPYSCSLLKKDASELQTFATLLRGYPIATSEKDTARRSTIAYGLGPLWLSAKAQVNRVVRAPQGYVRGYDVYTIDFNGDENKDFKYKLRFYFRDGFKFVDSVEWISGMQKSGKVLVELRSKTVQMPGNEQIPDEIFDIPAGYGCVRGPDFDHPFRVKFGSTFLHEGAPNKAILEVSLSQPKDATHHSWQTSRYSLSVMRGTMRLNEVTRSYYVSLVQYRHPLTGKLNRQRKVWQDSSMSSSTALLYSINPDSGDCKASHVPSAERLRLEFPNVATPIKISLDLLEWLFNNWDGFHLIDEKPSVLSLILKQATYERRMQQLRLDEEKSEPLWAGPVSIVKEVSLMGQYVTYPFNINDIKLFESYHTKVTIFFYSDDQTNVQYKISFDLFENTIIDVNHMQRQLDIGVCIPEKRHNEIVVKYPIEEEESKSSLVAMQDTLLELFCLNLFSSTPIDPLMVNNFEVSFDQFDMFIKMNLLDIPLWQSYQMKSGLNLASGDQLYEKSVGSLESCSEACEHYSCLRFAYDSSHKRCQLEVGLKQSLQTTANNKDSSLYEAPKLVMHSPWTDLDPNNGKKHLRPHELLELMRQFVSYSESDDQAKSKDESVNIPLTIKIERSFMAGDESSAEFITLKPHSIHSSLDDMMEIMRIAPKTDNQSNAGHQNELLFLSDKTRLRAEYSILLEDRDFDRGKEAGEEFGVSSYDECAANCDDLNCRSFSYCETTKKCIVSRMHNSTELQKASRQSFTCTISVLDYLTKFESFGPAALPIKAKKVITGHTERDCAHLCIEDRGINCQAFYFCTGDSKNKKEPPKCYLEDTHIHDVNTMGLESIVAYQLVTGGFAAPSRSESQPCNFYSRSYLAQFDQFVGKSLDNLAAAAESGGNSLEVESNFGPDACARQCIERSCIGFDVCLQSELEEEGGVPQTSEGREETKTTTTPTSVRLRQTCRMSYNSIKRSDLSTKRKGCSTFVLSDNSRFRSATATIMDLSQLADYKALDNERKGGEEASDIIVDLNQKQAEDGDIMSGLMKILSGSLGSNSIGNKESIVGGSHWLSRLLSVLFGLLLGVCCAIFFSRKEINMSQQFAWIRMKRTTIFGR